MIYWIICIVKIIQDIAVTRKFKNCYSQLEPEIQQKVDKALSLIKENFYHPSLHTKKIKGIGNKNIWEARIDIKYRFIFELEDGKCWLLEAGPHKIVER
jgi:mRNA-degrading endonuclease RelE of RelBE toxin-antitoxin system